MHYLRRDAEASSLVLGLAQDADDIADKMGRILADSTRRDAMGRWARARGEQTWAIRAAQPDGALRAVIGS